MALLCVAPLGAQANNAAPAQREMNFTGTLASSGPPLPRDMLIVQPYLIQTQVTGRYDVEGRRKDVDGVPEDWRLAVPILYGITDKLTVSATLRAIYARSLAVDRRWASGDTTLSAQYRLFQGQGAARPTLAAGVRQNMPTGRHDQLDRHGLADATGSGAAFTLLGLYGQAYLLPERNLRARLNVHYRVPGAGVDINGRSGYGTAGNYTGRAHLGTAWQAVAGAEYSINPQWVLAGDVVYERENGTHLHTGTQNANGTLRRDGRRSDSWRVSVAPAIEYHPSRSVGIIGGVLVSLDGRNSTELLSPQLSVMMVF